MCKCKHKLMYYIQVILTYKTTINFYFVRDFFNSDVKYLL